MLTTECHLRAQRSAADKDWQPLNRFWFHQNTWQKTKLAYRPVWIYLWQQRLSWFHGSLLLLYCTPASVLCWSWPHLGQAHTTVVECWCNPDCPSQKSGDKCSVGVYRSSLKPPELFQTHQGCLDKYQTYVISRKQNLPLRQYLDNSQWEATVI